MVGKLKQNKNNTTEIKNKKQIEQRRLVTFQDWGEK